MMIHMTKRRAKAAALLSFPGPGMGVNPDSCHQMLDKSLALAALVPGAAVLGCGAPAPEGPHAIRVARDRAILVTPASLSVQPGWHGSYALSLADDLFAAIILSGPRAEEIASACTATPLDGSSPSATTLFAGVGALVTRAGETLVIRVQTPDAAYLWSCLHRLAAA